MWYLLIAIKINGNKNAIKEWERLWTDRFRSLFSHYFISKRTDKFAPGRYCIIASRWPRQSALSLLLWIYYCSMVICCSSVIYIVYSCSPILTFSPIHSIFIDPGGQSLWSHSSAVSSAGLIFTTILISIGVFRMDHTIAPLVNWTHHQSASSRSEIGADSSDDPTSMRSTLPFASNSTHDADGIAMPAAASFRSCRTSNTSLRVGVNTDGPLAPDCSVFCADPLVDPTSMPSNSTEDVGDL